MDKDLFRTLRQATSRRHWLGLVTALVLFFLWQVIEQSVAAQQIIIRQHAEMLEYGLVAVIATTVTVINLRQRDRQLIEQERLRIEHWQTEQSVVQLEAARATAVAAAHNLNQPLTAIMGYVQLLLIVPPAERTDADCHAILQATKQAARYVRQLQQIERYATTPYASSTPMLDLAAQGRHTAPDESSWGDEH